MAGAGHGVVVDSPSEKMRVQDTVVVLWSFVAQSRNKSPHLAVWMTWQRAEVTRVAVLGRGSLDSKACGSPSHEFSPRSGWGRRAPTLPSRATKAEGTPFGW